LSEQLASNDPGLQKRRSTRIVQAVPISVTGVDALGQPFKERTTTVMVNCHGAKYQSKHYVPKNSTVTLEIPRPEPDIPPRKVQGRVIWVQRPRTVRELFQIALEFDTPGNVWGIAFPPEDWFPCPEDQGSVIPAPSQSGGAIEIDVTAIPHTPSAAAPPPPVPEQHAEAAPEATAEGKIHVVPSAPAPAAASAEAQAVVARQMAKMVADAKETLDKSLRREAQTAINDEMTVVRQQLDAQLHDAVERAIKSSMERVTESETRKVVQQAANRTNELVEEARRTTEASIGQLDAKVRQAVEQAVSGAAERAAKEAAEQTAALNLQQAVEATIDRIISEREAASPSLGILSSPEAAQQHLDQWKKSLEETAQGVRDRTLEQATQAADEAGQRWQEQFDAAVTGASQKIGHQLEEVSKAALAQAEADISARSVNLRASLDEVVAGAEARIQSLGAGLEQERAKADATREQIQEAARTTLENTRQRLNEMLAEQQEEIARKADRVVAERVEQIAPVLENAAQSVVDRFSGELNQKLAPGIAEAQKAISDLAGVSEQAAQVQARVHDTVKEASERAFSESLEKARQESAKLPAELEQQMRATLSKAEEELDQKATEAQHTTYEELSKAADWYQKKAQTTMQSTMERSVEQSTATLRDRAAEISSLVASELDHYRRSYLEHSQAQIEEAAKEVIDRERGKLNESASAAGASFSDQVQRVAGESLRRFEEASRQALEKARSDMEYNREGSLTDFQKRLDDQMAAGIEEARLHLQSQLGPLVEKWEEQRVAQQRDWMEQLKKSTDESIEQYKARLENASNSWLLASATTLGQHSQAVLDTLAKSAEKRIRETCSDVLAGMGDTIKERLLGISGKFGAEDDDEEAPPKKK